MKSQSIKFVSLISLCLLAIAMLVMGVWSVTAPSLNINGNVDMTVGTNALYIKDLRIKDADDPSDTGTTFENFDPGFVHNNIPVNLGRIDRTSSFILLFDVVNTTTTYYMASTNSTVSGATLSAEGILMNSGISPTEAVTTSEISGTISLTVTLTSSSPVTLNNVVINFEETSGITVYSTDSTRGTGYATGVAMDGQTVTLNAEFTEDLEADFLGWRVGSATGEVISTLPEYTFTFNEGDPTTYYAEFTEPNTFLTYSTLSTNTVEVSGTSGNSPTEIIIPAMIFRSDIPASRVTEIGTGAFENESGITSITIADTITTIGENAFRRMYGLTSVNFGTGSQLDTIEQRAFYMCYNLPSISLPDSLTYIDFEAFAQCYGLSSINIPENVETVYSEAFSNCSALTQVTIESALVYQSIITEYSVGDALENNNTRIYVPIDIVDKYDSTYLEDTNNYAKSTSGDYYIFTKGLGFTFTISSGSTATLTGYTGSDTDVTIPETFSLFNGVAVAGTDYTVTAIGINAFRDNSTLRFITIPDCITSIGAGAFMSCSNLLRITIPGTLATIGESAFAYCASLRSITLPANLQAANIGQSAFSNCSGLETVIVESADVYEDLVNEESWRGGGILRNVDAQIYVTQSIVSKYTNNYLTNTSYYTRTTSGIYYVFTRITLDFTFTTSGSTPTLTGYTGSATSVTIPETFSLFNGVAFAGATYTVTAIGASAFEGNTIVRNITIPDTVTSIGASAFYGCTNLRTVTVPDAVDFIGDFAFYNCSNLTSITIPVGVKLISTSTFTNCNNLKTVTIESPDIYEDLQTPTSCYGLIQHAETIYVPQNIVNDYTNYYITSAYVMMSSGSYYVFTKS